MTAPCPCGCGGTVGWPTEAMLARERWFNGGTLADHGIGTDARCQAHPNEALPCRECAVERVGRAVIRQATVDVYEGIKQTDLAEPITGAYQMRDPEKWASEPVANAFDSLSKTYAEPNPFLPAEIGPNGGPLLDEPEFTEGYALIDPAVIEALTVKRTY